MKYALPCWESFRPLAGMNCNAKYDYLPQQIRFPSPRGDELQLTSKQELGKMLNGFRPLAGMNCNPGAKFTPKAIFVSVPSRG